MKFKTPAISEGVFAEVHNRMSDEERSAMYALMAEASAILKFAGYAERLVFNDAFVKGYLASKIDLEPEP